MIDPGGNRRINLANPSSFFGSKLDLQGDHLIAEPPRCCLQGAIGGAMRDNRAGVTNIGH